MRNKISSNLEDELPYLLDRVTKKIQDAKLDFTPLDDGSGYGGSYRMFVYPNNNAPKQHKFYFRFVDSAYQKKSFELTFSGNEAQKKVAHEAVAGMLERDHHLFNYGQGSHLSELDDRQLEFIIRRKLKNLEKKFPDEFSFNPTAENPKKYIFSMPKVMPTGKKQKDGSDSTKLKIHIRDADCIDKLNSEYIKDAAVIQLSSSTNNMNEVKETERRVIDILKKYSVFEYKMDAYGIRKPDKEIPKDWVKRENIEIFTRKLRNGQKLYSVDIVPKSVKKRIPAITIAFSNSSYDEVEKIRDYLRGQDGVVSAYLEGTHRDEPLTLKIIKNDLEKKFPDIVNRKQHSLPCHFDIRNVMLGSDIKMTLHTPALRPKDQSCRIQCLPAQEDKKVRVAKKRIAVPLNTMDMELARGRMNALQGLTKVVLEEYFNQHPSVEVITENSQITKHKKRVAATRFRKANPGEEVPEGKVFFDTLREDVLKPAYEQFNRYIYWETKIEKEKDGDGYIITAQVKRNKDAEEFPENDTMLGKEWKFKARDEKEAIAFSHTLEESILRKEHLFSRERPVDQFGVNSMRLVAKQSLLETVGASPNIEDLQEKLMKILNSGRKMASG